MLTEIFAERYKDVPIWDVYGENERRMLVQAYKILSEQVHPIYGPDKKERPEALETWTAISKRLCMELGVQSLSSPMYLGVDKNWHFNTIFSICQSFVCGPYDGKVKVDQFIKERLSFVEIGFRDREDVLRAANRKYPHELAAAKLRDKAVVRLAGNVETYAGKARHANDWMNRVFKENVNEFNVRLQRAGTNLNYHNGFIQVVEDPLIEANIETPFWGLVADPKWKNVDTDMKEAIDLRDSGGRDPAFYAARALESAIKIISTDKGWTRGTEKGAANFIDNLVSKANGRFIDVWEGDTLRSFFSSVRNELGHGPGGEPMPELTSQQTSWAIEFCMAWIKSLIRRLL